jgi:hypothetical protein
MENVLKPFYEWRKGWVEKEENIFHMPITTFTQEGTIDKIYFMMVLI